LLHHGALVEEVTEELDVWVRELRDESIGALCPYYQLVELLVRTGGLAVRLDID
jgi:hypothetical protein